MLRKKIIGVGTPLTGLLMATADGQSANELQYLGNYAFGIAADPTVRMTFTIAAGSATRVTLLQGGNTINGSKAP